MMTWSGPEPYTVESSTSATIVHSSLSFSAYRTMDTQAHQLITKFTEIAISDPDHAVNIPSLTLVKQFQQIITYCKSTSTTENNNKNNSKMFETSFKV